MNCNINFTYIIKIRFELRPVRREGGGINLQTSEKLNIFFLITTLTNLLPPIQNYSNLEMPKATNTNKRGPYNERKDQKYWGVYYLNLAGHSQREIAELVELPLSTVNSIIARIKKTDSPLPRASPGAPKKSMKEV